MPRWCWPSPPAPIRARWPRRSRRKLDALPAVTSAEIAGPGFINLRLAPRAWLDELRAIAALGADYGRSTMGGGRAVNVEYVSANPTGPMHMGHCRGAVVGDALATPARICRA